MSSQALSLPFPLFGSSTTPVTGKPPGRHTGIAVALLLHFLVGLLIYRQVVDQAQSTEAPKGDQLIRIVSLQAAAAAAATAALPPPELPVEPAKPVVKPVPRPKPVVKKQPPLIAAPAPVPSPQALPQQQQEQQQQAAPAAPPAATPTQGAITATQAPSAGAIGRQAFTLTQAETDRLEYAYKLAVSRAIAAQLHGSVLMQQLGGSGQALVRLTIGRDGSVLGSTLLRGTGFQHLDNEARFVAVRIAHFLPVPRYLRPDNPTIVIDQPVTFIPQ